MQATPNRATRRRAARDAKKEAKRSGKGAPSKLVVVPPTSPAMPQSGGLLDILSASSNSTFLQCGCQCCKTVNKALTCIRLAMFDVGLANACLMQSVILSEMLLGRGIPCMVVAGYLTFMSSMSIRHVWVHVLGCENGNHIADVLIPSDNVMCMHPEYSLTLPQGCDLLDNDEDSIEVSRELESILAEVCVQSQGMTMVAKREVVVRKVESVQKLWGSVLRTTGTEHLLEK